MHPLYRFNVIEHYYFFLMNKRPTVINLTLTAPKDIPQVQIPSNTQKSEDQRIKNSHLKDQGITQHIINFIHLMAQERTSLKKKQKKDNSPKEPLKSISKTEKQPNIAIPLPIAQAIEVLLRRYMLTKIDERQDPLHSRSKFITPNRNNHLRAFIYKNNKENTQATQQDDQNLDIFRSIACQKMDREKLANRNRDLENEVAVLRERMREKNCLISKLLTKQTQLRRKYNDELNRLTRNKNIYDISANFQKTQDEGQGRNLLNITGKHIVDSQEQEFKRSSLFKNGYKSVKTLIKSDSEYFKDGKDKSRIIMTKGKLTPFRCSKKNTNQSSPSTKFLKSINKSLPTECIAKSPLGQREEPRGKKGVNATFQLYINQLQSNLMSSKQSIHLNEQERLEMIGKLKDEEFQALQMVGFYEGKGDGEGEGHIGL